MSLIVHQVPYVSGTNGEVYPITDRRLYDFFASGQSGVVTGCTVTNPSLNTLEIATGWGIASGCVFSIASESVTATVASSGTKLGELILQIDTSASTATWITNANDSTSPLTQDDLTVSDGVYEIRFATYDIDTSGNISNLTETFPIVNPGAGLATLSTPGIVKPDGSTITVDANGEISAIGGSQTTVLNIVPTCTYGTWTMQLRKSGNVVNCTYTLSTSSTTTAGSHPLSGDTIPESYRPKVSAFGGICREDTGVQGTGLMEFKSDGSIIYGSGSAGVSGVDMSGTTTWVI